MINSIFSKEELNSLYLSGKSMYEISKIFNCSTHKIVYWMNKYDISRRSRSDALYKKLNPDGDPFTIKAITSSEDIMLFGLGLGIYWGEGEKVSTNAIRVANTDPYIIITFVRFLREICQLEERKLGYSIVCFQDSSIEDTKKFWSKLLKISEEKFGKIVQIPPQGKGNYKKKSQYGVCTVSVSNIRLKAWLMNEIDKVKFLPT